MLKIKANGKLERTYWSTKNQADSTQDITDVSFSYLFDYCSLDDGVVLKDIILLVNHNIDIYDLILGNCYVKELIEEALNKTPSDRTDPVEWLEISRGVCSIDKQDGFSLGGLHFSGCSVASERDADLHCEPGEIIKWSMDFVPLHQMINLPLKIDSNIVICNEINNSHHTGNVDDTKEYTSSFVFTLGELIYGIFYELSFYGSPSDRDKKKHELHQAIASVDLDISG